MPSIRSDKVIDTWATVVKDGAGKDGWVMQTTEQNIRTLRMLSVSAQTSQPAFLAQNGIFSW